MRYLYYLIVTLSFFLSACQFASFTERPGIIKKSFPVDMYGVYINIDKSNGVKDTHRLVIDSMGAHIDEPFLGRIINLSDTNNSLTHLGDFYYLNLKDRDSIGDFTYFVYPFEYDSKNLYVYKLILSDKSMKRMAKCGLKQSGKRDGQYIMDNMSFKKYVEKYLKKRDAIKFKKIN